MNLRFVFSLIVSLLSLLPAAAQDLTRNWIRERIFLDAEGQECVTSVQYFDGIGRETLLLTDGLSPGGGVAGALTGESFAGRTAVVRDGVLRKKGRSRFILYDRLGSVRSVADEDGNVLQQNLYYARGGAWGDVCTAPGGQSYKYCGKYLDRKHGLDLYDYGARLYDPAAAFWTSPDPLCEKYYNISPYAFCNDNPVTFIDPDGRDPGDPFTSLDNAALDFCRIFNYWSMTRNPGYPYGAEYASVFYSYKDKEDNIRYSYYVFGPHKATTCNIKLDPQLVPYKRRKSHKFVATGHTHGGYMPGYAGNYFSRIDIVSYYKDRKKYPTCNTAYLATTNGTFMKCIYRKNIDKWMVYSFKGGKYQLPSDANDPTHNKYTYQLITEKFYSTKKFYEIFKSLSKYLGKGEYFK